jgi:flagellar L-ring protein precursor FlgH
MIRLYFLLLGGCGLAEKLSEVGDPPQLSYIQDPTTLPNYRPVTMPMPACETSGHNHCKNSLWEMGSRAFFKDQRANQVGDILTVAVNIDQKESIEVRPQFDRQTGYKSTLGKLFGLEKGLSKIFNQKKTDSSIDPDILNASSNSSSNGSNSKYDIRDRIQFKIAATVIQLLPNGNMVIQGRQEIRLVNEVREIEIRGIVRKEDITTNNTIPNDKIAECRIIYGGRGDLSDMQSLPWGQQIANKLMPF